MQPRPGVGFPVDLALADTEAQLLANGITTAFHAVTLSWEPGLRSPEAWSALVDAVAARIEGKRADLVLIHADSGAVVATVAAGQVAHLGAGGWARVS